VPDDSHAAVEACTAIAAGKAAWPMLSVLTPFLAVRRGALACARPARPVQVPPTVEIFETGHPDPNEESVRAGRRALELCRAADDELVVVLLSGGASAMLCAPAPGISLDEKTETARALMEAGVAIDGLNCVRKHLSAIKGGRLGAAARRSLTLALSDVNGPVQDDPSVIGSGPTVADPTTHADALSIIRRSGARVPASVLRHLERGARGEVEESIKPGDPRLSGAQYEVIGNRHAALEGAMRVAQARGYAVVTLPGATSGEAREAAHAFLAEARWLAASAPRPLCVLASGETTVTVRGDGRGGRNQEFVLAAAPAIAAVGRAAVFGSAGTDGIDGPTDAAGAMVDSSTLERASRAGVDWRDALGRNDAYHFFEPLGDLIRWGPTGTNVGDVHVLLIA
jgi:glycerate 2-kinase